MIKKKTPLISSKDRIVILHSDHCRWWLIHPDSLIYYDKIVLDKADYERTINAGGSSCHDLISENANWIAKNSVALTL